MTLSPDTLSVDCADCVVAASFWASALGYELDPDSDVESAYIGDPSGRTAGIFFERVPEPKTAKNRMHLDLRPSGSMAEEVERLQGLGATVGPFIEEPASAVDGQATFWTVMQDPEGNEFRVLRGPDDGWTPR
jgi:hypothetical protein